MLRSEIDAIPLEGDVSFRQRAVELDKAALLVIDLQKGEYNAEKIAAEPEDAYLWNRIADTVIPNGQRLLSACREVGVEVIYTVVECLTLDGRDRGLDYKISGIFAAKGSLEAEVIDELAPLENEILIPKTSSSATPPSQLRLTPFITRMRPSRSTSWRPCGQCARRAS